MRLRDAVALAASVALPACSAHPAPPQDELVWVLASNPADLDPRFAPDAFSDRITRLIFSTLLVRGADGSLSPHLASELSHPDALTWVVRIRDGVRFHDGSSLDSADVVATFESIRQPERGSVKRGFLEPVAGIEAPDPATVIFRLKEASAPFPQVLAGIGIAPAEAAAGPEADAAFRRALPGSGPFRFVEAVADSHVLLARNDAWFAGAAGSPRLRFRVVPDGTVRVLEVMHGGADITQNDLPPHVIPRLARDPKLRVVTGDSTLVKYLAFNTAHPGLSDRRVREAIALGIDRDAVIRHKLRGYADAASGFLSPRSWAYEPELRQVRADPGRARRLLDAAGFPAPADGGPRLRLVWRTSMDPTSVSVARVFARQLAQIGVEVDVRSNEWGVFFSDIRQGDFDLFTLSGVGINDPDWHAFVFHSRSIPPGGANRSRWNDPRTDALLDAGRTTATEAERIPIYRELQRILADELPMMPLWYEQNVAVMGRNVVGYEPLADGDWTSVTAARKEGPR
jgi:peptide/nickel transport system substrate-binding protein